MVDEQSSKIDSHMKPYIAIYKVVARHLKPMPARPLGELGTRLGPPAY